MYLPNKYTEWYNAIIANAKLRTLLNTEYSEKHHIIPRSLGGDDSKENLVRLTAREHFICHLLLTKMLTGGSRAKMILALSCMTLESKNQSRHKLKSRQYDYIRTELSKCSQGSGNPSYGRKRTEDEIARAVASRKANDINRPKYSHSAETRKKLSESRKGKPRPDYLKEQWSKVRKGRPGQDNNSGKKWFNDGVKSYLKHECPPGCVPGRL